MQSILKLVPLDAARRLFGATGPAAGDPSGTVRQGPMVPGERAVSGRATAMCAPYTVSARWLVHRDGHVLTDAQVADWPVVPPRDGATTDQTESRSR